MLPLKDNIPTDRFPIVTVVLIAINIAAFVWQITASTDPGSAPSEQLARADGSEFDQRVIEYGTIPKEILHPGTYCVTAVSEDEKPKCGSRKEIEEESGVDQAPWWMTLFTSMFMHGDILHIAGNMLFLFIFGNNIEDSMGRFRFVLFYLASGLVADYAQAGIEPNSDVPQIGASGAVAGVLGAYALQFPRAKVLTLVFIIFFVTFVEIPAMIMLGIWFLLQFLPAVGQQALQEPGGEGGGVAYFAHVGGFLFGLAMIKLLAKRHKDTQPQPKYPVY